MGYVAGLEDAPGGRNEVAAMIREILDAAPPPRQPLPEGADGFTLVQESPAWVATHDGKPE
jgi:hypothetical protein